MSRLVPHRESTGCRGIARWHRGPVLGRGIRRRLTDQFRMSRRRQITEQATLSRAWWTSARRSVRTRRADFRVGSPVRSRRQANGISVYTSGTMTSFSSPSGLADRRIERCRPRSPAAGAVRRRAISPTDSRRGGCSPLAGGQVQPQSQSQPMHSSSSPSRIPVANSSITGRTASISSPNTVAAEHIIDTSNKALLTDQFRMSWRVAFRCPAMASMMPGCVSRS